MGIPEILIGLLVVGYSVIFVWKTKTGSPSVWSKNQHIKRLVKYIKPGMKVADMGCGDGRVMVAAVKAGAEMAEGWEIEPAAYIAAKITVKKAKMQNQITVHFGDMWGAKLGKFDLVYVYQLTRYAPRFAAKCKKEMRQGTIVVANTYPIVGLCEIARDKYMYVYMI